MSVRSVLLPALWIVLAVAPPRLAAQQAGTDSVSIRFIDTDLRAVVQALAPYLDRPLIMPNLPVTKVSLATPAPVARAVVIELLRGLLASQKLVLRQEDTYYQIDVPAPQPEASPVRAGGQAGPVRLHVIRMRHARASDVAATINLLFGGAGQFSGSQTLGASLSDQLRGNLVPPGAASAESPPTTTAPAAALQGAVTLVPEPLTNSLLVRATDEDHAVIKAAVEQIDIRPLQVLIEVLIVEARRDRSFSLGADLFMPQTPVGSGDGSIGGTLLGGGLGDLVIRLLNIGKANVDAVLRTAQSRGQVNIVSRPVLVTSNNTEARFLVGSQRPFVQVSRVQPTDQASRDQVVQYRDVGTKLTVRPTINQDGYVSLVIQQEINAATEETQFDAPIISTREAATQVLVRDGQTIVLGGLSDRQQDQKQSGVPILSGIPILGGLFGSASRRSTTTELYLFLTPRIIRSDAEADSLTQPRLPPEFRRDSIAH